jgi:hypothetical protein
MCRTGCPTQDHESWGDCARDANMRIQGQTAAKVNKDLNTYAYAKSIGLQPEKSTHKAAQAAIQAVGA